MPAQSQQQQKLFGLALAVKRGEVPASEVSDEVNAIVDRMSEKDIEDFASTSHKGLPKKVEAQLREIVREIMRERAISEINENESVNEADVKKKINRRGDIDGLIVTHKGNDYEIVYSSDFSMSGAIQPYGIVMPGDDVVSFLSKDKKAKSIWKELKPKVDKFVKSNESINEGASTEEKRIVMAVIKKIAKYRNVPLDYAVGDVIRAAEELERDIQKGKVK